MVANIDWGERAPGISSLEIGKNLKIIVRVPAKNAEAGNHV